MLVEYRYVTIGFTFGFALLLILIDWIMDETAATVAKGTTPSARSVAVACYHSWAALLGGEDYEWVTGQCSFYFGGGGGLVFFFFFGFFQMGVMDDDPTHATRSLA